MKIVVSSPQLEYHYGDTLQIVCEADLGKPPGELKWTRHTDDAPVSSKNLKISTENAAQKTPCMYHGRSTITYIIGHRDKGLQFRCEVSNEAMASPLIQIIKINVVGM